MLRRKRGKLLCRNARINKKYIKIDELNRHLKGCRFYLSNFNRLPFLDSSNLPL